MKDKLNITIRIAELPPMPMSINRSDEEVIRTAEFYVNKLWKSWSQRYSDKKPDEILAMIAFQFAKSVVQLNAQAEAATALVDGFEQQLDNILLEIAPDLTEKSVGEGVSKSLF